LYGCYAEFACVGIRLFKLRPLTYEIKHV